MSKEEIKSGILNAFTRGESLENTKTSFVNAGYNPQEVEQAMKEVAISMGIEYPLKNQAPPQISANNPNTIQNQEQVRTVTTEETTYTTEQPQMPIQQVYKSVEVTKTRRRFPLGIIFLFIILFVLIGSLIASVLFGKELLDFMFK